VGELPEFLCVILKFHREIKCPEIPVVVVPMAYIFAFSTQNT